MSQNGKQTIFGMLGDGLMLKGLIKHAKTRSFPHIWLYKK